MNKAAQSEVACSDAIIPQGKGYQTVICPHDQQNDLLLLH